jgi:hypothetical protein
VCLLLLTVLREVFVSFDYKNTGTVEVDELQHAFALYDKYSQEEIDEIFAAVVSLLSIIQCLLHSFLTSHLV